MGTLVERFMYLQNATATGAQIEQVLLREAVRAHSLVSTQHPGLSTAHEVVLESRKAIFKPFSGQHPNACANHGHSRVEAPVHEVVAWRLARAMGDPWDQLLPAAVLREIPECGGSGVLINYRAGKAGDPDVFSRAPVQVSAAAFWDILIGQQDRHINNYRYDAASNRLALIDNAFAFARPNDLHVNSIFAVHRRSNHKSRLTDAEVEALEALLASDVHELGNYLGPGRADALEKRAERMVDQRQLLLPSDY